MNYIVTALNERGKRKVTNTFSLYSLSKDKLTSQPHGRSLTATSIVSGIAFPKTQQNGDGGFSTGDSVSDPNNTNSTALAVQGILAAGSDPLSAMWTISSSNPISFMLSLQGPDGSLHYTAAFSESRQMATQQVIPTLTGRPFPYASRAVALRKAIDWIASQQQADGSFAGFGTGATLDAVLAIASTGRAPQSFVSSSGKTPRDFLVTQVPTYSNSSTAAAGKLLANGSPSPDRISKSKTWSRSFPPVPIAQSPWTTKPIGPPPWPCAFPAWAKSDWRSVSSTLT